MPMPMPWRFLSILAMLSLLLPGCGESPPEIAPASVHELATIGPDEECHVCGMTINGFAGPKAQAFVRHQRFPFAFCSTRDFFSWVLQPETAAILSAAYVQDMDQQSWDQPQGAAYVEASHAWYVVGHGLQGAMGATLASFGTVAAAQDFAAHNGGQVIAYADVTLELLTSLEVLPLRGE